MEVNAVKSLLNQTLDHNHVVRKNAEDQLRSLEKKHGFAIVLLQILEATAVQPQDKAIQQASAIFFKNFVKKRWPQVSLKTRRGEVRLS